MVGGGADRTGVPGEAGRTEEERETHDLRFLAASLAEFEDRGERPSPATLAYLLHQARPESMVDVAEIVDDEPCSLVGAEAACVYLAGQVDGAWFLATLEFLIDEEGDTWVIRHPAR